MQKTRNNCLGRKNFQYHFSKLLLHFGTRAYLLSPEKGCATVFFRPETIVASLLHLMVLFFKVLLNHCSKRQCLVLHCRKDIFAAKK